ncbi:DUF456 domain-containing protein [Arthrobacter castelli]|uniref:DUF456 domain-containing protein n=1 Tax=Arthrobacter castelli TaxID=271431 RepID=UPI0004014574|nr:DUF456 domain-containing protein [Arthrobacter castelli]
MAVSVIVAIVCAALILVGIIGVIVPVLPGSVLVGVSLLIWAITVQSATGWVIFATGAVLVTAGMTSSAVLTGRRMKRRQVPNRSLLVGAGFAVVGLFMIPVVGLFVGFALGLLLAEYRRQRDFRAAVDSSWEALKAAGIGILVECGLACLAASVWVIGVWIHFAMA